MKTNAKLRNLKPMHRYYQVVFKVDAPLSIHTHPCLQEVNTAALLDQEEILWKFY